MGLDAGVRCRCWEDGIAPPPPCAVRLDADAWLEPVDDADWEAFVAWMQRCPHEDMEVCSEHVGNWSGVRLFEQALRTLPSAACPTLMRVLPAANGGTVSPAEAKEALLELDRFEAAYASTISVLVDDEGVELRAYVEAYDGVFVLDGSTGLHIGFDPAGLFIVERATGAEVFRAMRVRQTLLGSDGPARLVDEDTGTTYVSRSPIPGRHEPDPDHPGKERPIHPSRLSVETRVERADAFAWIVGALRRLFRASVEIGNPVRWA